MNANCIALPNNKNTQTESTKDEITSNGHVFFVFFKNLELEIDKDN